MLKELYSYPERKSLDIIEFKDGRTFERHSEPLIIEQVILGRIWYFRDITEKVSKDRQIQAQNEQLIQAFKLSSLGLLAGEVAHEINNPLAIIRTSVLTLEKMMTQPDYNQEFAKNAFEDIKVTIERIDKITSGLLKSTLARALKYNTDNDS